MAWSSKYRTENISIAVIYGTGLACLQETANLHKEKYPTGSIIALRDFYVDDLLNGANTIKEAIQIREDAITLLAEGAFELRKWASNCDLVLHDGQQEANKTVVKLVYWSKIKSKNFGFRIGL